jgi:hypothetical protein
MANFRIAGVLFGSTLMALLNLGAARATEERLGEVDFPISCSPMAQQQFNRAERVHRHCQSRTVLCHGLLGDRDQPAP